MYTKRTWWPVIAASLFAVGSILIVSASAGAQNLPPPGAYQPIPNFTGVGAGLQFREAINDRLSGAQPVFPTLVSPGFGNLPAETDGAMLYCKDCKRTTPCAGGGSGAWALGTRGQWSCSTGPLETSLSANGNKITSLANGTATGDALAFGQTSGGDLGGSFPNPTVATVLGGKAPLYAGQTGAQINTLSGAKGDGSDAVSGFNVNGIVNVKAYGAKGDGTTDDSGAINAAIAAACAVQTGSDGGGNFTSVASQVVLPPAPYRLMNPLWMNCSGLQLVGAGRYSSVLSPAYDGKTIALVGPGYQGLPTTASLVAGSGNAADFTISQNGYWLNLRELAGGFGHSGPLGSPAGLNLNGLGAFTIEAFVKDKTAGDGSIVSSSSQPSSSGFAQAATLTISSGDWRVTLNTTGGNGVVYGSSVALNAVEYVAATWDGTTLRLYNCTPGATNCAAAGSSSLTGTIVQDPTEDVTIGPALGGSWPNGAVENGAINGYVDSVRISNVARWTGTIANVPNAKFSADSNTLALTNFEKNPQGSPFIKVYEPSGGSGWLLEYNVSRAGVTGLSRDSIRDIGISPASADASGVWIDSSNDDDIGPIQMSNMEIGLEVWNLSLENSFHDLTINCGGGRYGIVNNSNDNHFNYTKVNGCWAGYDFDGSGTLIDPIWVQSGTPGNAYGLVIPPGGAPSVEIHSPWWDVENAGTGSFKAAIFGSGISNVDIFGGQIGVASAAPAIWLDNGGNSTVTGTLIASIEGSPSQLVKITGSGNRSVRLNNPLLSGWGSAALSTTAGVVSMTPCSGPVTLASGAGTFSNICLTTTSICNGRDLTNGAHTFTIGTPINGSVGISAGTGTDVIQLSCN